MALEQITFNIGAFNDANAGGNNYYTNTVFEVRSQSDNTFASIYSDESGNNLIPQNGIDNISNSVGECEFYIGEGEFYILVDSKKRNFSTLKNNDAEDVFFIGGQNVQEFKDDVDNRIELLDVNSVGNKVKPRQRFSANYVIEKFRPVKSMVSFMPAGAVQLTRLTIPFVLADGDVKVRFKLGGVSDFNSDVFPIIGVCDDLSRSGFSGLTPTNTTYGDVIESVVTPVSKSFISIDIRYESTADYPAQVYSIEAFQGGKCIGKTLFERMPAKYNWDEGVSSLYKTITGIGMDHATATTIYGDSDFISPSMYDCVSGGDDDDIKSVKWSLELNRKWQEQVDEMDKWKFDEGKHYTYRRYQVLNLFRESYLMGNNSTLLGGRELVDWTDEGNNGFQVWSAAYDWDTSPESAIRAGTKQPFVSVLTRETFGTADETKSMRDFKLTNVSSIAEVESNDFSYFYDYANKRVYWSFGQINSYPIAYPYVCEVDNNIKSITGLFAYGINAIASKTDDWRIAPSSYNVARYSGLYNCKGGVSAGGSGAFSIDNMDGELIQCYATSHLNDGFNFHGVGTTLLDNCDALRNGDDGVSHHDNCVGYIVDSRMHYNYAACSVPAFGAFVWHKNCSGLPADNLSTKDYSGTFACISNDDGNAWAWYDNCYTSTRDIAPSHYYLSAQSASASAKMYVNQPRPQNQNNTFAINDDNDNVLVVTNGYDYS